MRKTIKITILIIATFIVSILCARNNESYGLMFPLIVLVLLFFIKGLLLFLRY
jgi:hypothetical protein